MHRNSGLGTVGGEHLDAGDGDRQELHVDARRIHLGQSFGFQVQLEDQDVLKLVIDRAGVDNVMWAVDYPFESSADAATFIDQADLDPAQRAAICHANAERMFRIAPA